MHRYGHTGRESQHSIISCPTSAQRITKEDIKIPAGEGLCGVDREWCLRARWRVGNCEPKAMDLSLSKKLHVAHNCAQERESAVKNWQAQGLGRQSAGNVLTPLFISLLYSNVGLESEGGSKWGQRTEANPYFFPQTVNHRPVLGEDEENCLFGVKTQALYRVGPSNSESRLPLLKSTILTIDYVGVSQ